MATFQRIEFSAIGVPQEVAAVSEAEMTAPGAGEVCVRMEFAPINPADINYLQGNYGVQAELPTTPGMEGCGFVTAIGDGVTDLAPGDKVVLFDHIGSWSEVVCVQRDHLVRVPGELDSAQAAMLRVNPPTAWRLLTGYVQLKPGDWVVQNAANSGVGLALIQLAKALGLHTINAVRSEVAAEICRAHGADIVLIDDDDFCKNARDALAAAGGTVPRLASNAVGGDSALRLMDLLGEEGTHVTYGAMSRQSLKVPNKFLIFKRLNLHGLWVTKWMDVLPLAEREELFAQLAGYMVDGKLNLPVEKAYSISEIGTALEHAQRSSRDGKILLDLR
ncbi:MAG: 2-enoyl thioester reductase domain-containing protein [Verrucomicrobiales bacterium]